MFHLSTEETLPTLVVGVFGLCAFGVVLFVWLVFVGFGFWVASPTNMQSFQSLFDDLGTPPAWRPHPWKRTPRLITLPRAMPK